MGKHPPRLNFWLDGDGYRVILSEDTGRYKDGLMEIQAFPLGDEMTVINEGTSPTNNGKLVPYETMKAFYQRLKDHFEGTTCNKPHADQHYEDLRQITFGLLEVLKK